MLVDKREQVWLSAFPKSNTYGFDHCFISNVIILCAPLTKHISEESKDAVFLLKIFFLWYWNWVRLERTAFTMWSYAIGTVILAYRPSDAIFENTSWNICITIASERRVDTFVNDRLIDFALFPIWLTHVLSKYITLTKNVHFFFFPKIIYWRWWTYLILFKLLIDRSLGYLLFRWHMLRCLTVFYHQKIFISCP